MNLAVRLDELTSASHLSLGIADLARWTQLSVLDAGDRGSPSLDEVAQGAWAEQRSSSLVYAAAN